MRKWECSFIAGLSNYSSNNEGNYFLVSVILPGWNLQLQEKTEA